MLMLHTAPVLKLSLERSWAAAASVPGSCVAELLQQLLSLEQLHTCIVHADLQVKRLCVDWTP